MNCQVCGAELVPGTQFCGSCGAPQAAPTAQTPMPPPVGAAGAPPGSALPPYPPTGPTGSEPPSGSSKKAVLWGGVALVVVLLLGLGAFLAFGGDDDEATSGSTSTTTEPPATTTSTTDVELLGLAEWVEEGDDICSDVNDDLGDIPGSTIEDAADALPDVIELLEGQLEDLEALGPPDDEPTVDDFLDLLADQIVFLQALDDEIQDGGDPEEVFEEATEDGDDLSGDLRDLADELEFEYCGQDPAGDEPPPTTDDPTPPTTSGGGDDPFTYGDDPELDALWDACAGGSAEACDDLWGQAPVDSEYEEFGFSCGGVVPEGEVEICSEVLGSSSDTGESFTFGDDAALDALWQACSAGDGQACDDLYWDSPIDSEYEAFGNTCGYRFPEADAPGTCVDAF